jgi:DNA-binding CsgD family transcriptional regulator
MHFTPTQRRILQVLADGEPHRPTELAAQLDDDMGPVSNVKPHLTAIRKLLRLRGEDILCVVPGPPHRRCLHYRWVRLRPAGLPLPQSLNV